MRRRTFLAAGGAVGLAGCLGRDSATDVPDSRTDAGAGTLSASTDDGPPSVGGTSAADSSPKRTSAAPGAVDGGTTARTATPTGTGTETGSGTRSSTGTPIHPGYEKTAVRIRTPGGERLASVTAAIADTSQLRYTGLSDTEHLPPDRGMLFVYEEVQDLTYVMREMDFGIDIVYADDEGVITKIHHAPAPGPNEDGNEQHYPGRGQYVLEVNYEFTDEHDVEVGDALAFDL